MPNFIRGYELNVIEGQQLLVHKNSLRFQLINTSFDLSRAIYNDQFNRLPLSIYLSGNFDQGAVRDRNRIPENLALTNQYLFGYGAGIDLVTGRLFKRKNLGGKSVKTSLLPLAQIRQNHTSQDLLHQMFEEPG